MNRFPIMTDCVQCQAFRDARELFSEMERIAGEHDLDPQRVARALRALTAQWTVVATTYTNGKSLDDAQADELVGATLAEIQYGLRVYLADEPPQHAH